MKLLIRPAPLPGESWPGFLWRIATLNRMNGVVALSEMLGMLPSQLIASSPVAILQAIGFELPDRDGVVLTTAIHPEGKIRLARVGRTSRTRICPECVREDKTVFIRAEWDGAVSFSCGRHKTILIDECPSCGMPVSYESRDLLVCKCGCLLKFEPHGRPYIDPRPIQQALSLQTSPSERDTFAPSTSHEIYAAWLLKRLGLAQVGQTRSKRAARLKGDAFISVSSAQSVYSWFADWPNGFIGQLACAQARDPRSPSDLLGVSRKFLAHEFPAVADAVEDFDRRRRTACRPKMSEPMTVASVDRSWIGLKKLMMMTGCTHHTIHSWIHLGWLGDVTTVQGPGGALQYLIDENRALRAVEISKKTAAIKHISKEIGIERGSLQALVRSGVLRSVPFGVAKWNVRVIPSEVFELTQALLHVAVRGRPVHTDNMLFGEAILYIDKKKREQLAPFIRAVLSGAVRIRAFVSSPMTLEEITIRRSDLERWMRSAEKCT